MGWGQKRPLILSYCGHEGLFVESTLIITRVYLLIYIFHIMRYNYTGG